MRRLPLLVALISCGSGDGGTLPPPPPPPLPTVASIRITSPYDLPGAPDGPAGGEAVQFGAVAMASGGEPIPGATIVWSEDSDLASISPNGLLQLADTSIGGRLIFIRASSAGVTSTETLFTDDWSVSRSVDAVTLETRTLATRNTSDASPRNLTLSVRCTDDDLELYISGDEITADGAVEYRFSGLPPTTRTWGESTNFKSLFIPDAALQAFLAQVNTRDSLHFRYNRFLGGTVTGVFLLGHAQRATSKPVAACD